MCITLLPGGFSQVQVHCVCCSKARTPAQVCLDLVEKVIWRQVLQIKFRNLTKRVNHSSLPLLWQIQHRIYEFGFKGHPRLLSFHFCFNEPLCYWDFLPLPPPLLFSLQSCYYLTIIQLHNLYNHYAFFPRVFPLLPPTLLQTLTFIFQGWVALTCQWNSSLLFECHF